MPSDHFVVANVFPLFKQSPRIRACRSLRNRSKKIYGLILGNGIGGVDSLGRCCWGNEGWWNTLFAILLNKIGKGLKIIFDFAKDFVKDGDSFESDSNTYEGFKWNLVVRAIQSAMLMSEFELDQK